MKQYITLLTLALAGNSAYAQVSKPINIVYIMSDDHSYQTISAYDKLHTSTPNIDRLSKNGVRFTNSFVCNSISGPSRAAMLTGKHSHMNGKLNNTDTYFDTSQPTFISHLKGTPYQTALIGKWHLDGIPQSFDHWEILVGQGTYYNPDFITEDGTKRHDGYVTDIITDKSIKWLENRDKERPFCLMIHHKAAHRSWISDSTNMFAYEDITFNVPKNFYDNYENRPAASNAEMSIYDDMDLPYDLKVDTTSKKGWSRVDIDRMTPAQRAQYDKLYDKVTKEFKESNLSGHELAEWKYQRYMRDYMKCINSMDSNIGRVIDYLEQSGLSENTIIVYTSDQGFYMGEHGWFDKRFMYEESFRTPLLVYLPSSLKKRGDINQLVQNIDYGPTFLELAGLEKPEDMQGDSFLPLLKADNPKDWRKSLYYHYYEYPAEHTVRKHYGVRTERYKLIHFYGDDIDNWEMYDIKKDPHEMNNIYGLSENKTIQNELHEELTKLRKQYKVTE